MKIVFMGTPDFSVPVLNGLIDAGHSVEYVITQPDKARNRGKKVSFSPVKEAAVENDITVLQPLKIKDSIEITEVLEECQPDIIVVVAYGQLIPKRILDMPKYGCINVHASLLPRLRGASPIQHAILCGEEKTGVTIMQMAEGLDTGDMLTKSETVVGNKNCEELHDELAEMGAVLLIETLKLIEEGRIHPEKQDDRLSTYAGMIIKEDGRIDFSKSPQEIERKIRAFDPWPGAFCMYGDQTMKIWKASWADDSAQAEDGTVLSVSDRGIDIACGGKILKAEEIQMPGKKRVEVRAFLRGNKIENNTILR